MVLLEIIHIVNEIKNKVLIIIVIDNFITIIYISVTILVTEENSKKSIRGVYFNLIKNKHSRKLLSSKTRN